MKKLIYLFTIVGALHQGMAQIRTASHEWTAKLKVVDETGKPVAGAEVSIAFCIASPQGDPVDQRVVGFTDTNGLFAASHTDPSVQLAFYAQKAGYYPFWVQHYLGFSVEKKNVDWNPTPTLVLKKVRSPIPMYAKWVNGTTPTNDIPVGLDLTVGDLVAPFGKGKTRDVIFTAHLAKRAQDDFDYTLTVSFPNQGDGIQGFEFPYPIGQGSALRSPHEAPEDGYEPRAVKSDSLRPGGFTRAIWNEKTNYFFRVRTVLDERGNVRSALYGKAYGDFNQFRYYLNPVPNDRNVEFDPSQNLLKGLKSFEQVVAP
jgi:hypothetical protein